MSEVPLRGVRSITLPGLQAYVRAHRPTICAAAHRAAPPPKRPPVHAGGAAPADRARCRVVCLVPVVVSYAYMLRSLELEPWHPDGRVAARQRRARPGQPGRVDLLLAERPGQGGPGAARAAVTGRESASTVRRPATATRPTTTGRRGSARCSTPRCPVRACGTRRSPTAAATPVLITSFRPDPLSPAGRRRSLDRPHATTTWLYPGRLEPNVGAALPRAHGGARALRSRLVATFNSGFKLSDSGGGFVDRRPHLRADEARAWRRSCATATGGSTSSPGTAARTPART